MENDHTPLQFTVSDRDMLRDTYQGVQAIIKRLDGGEDRFEKHEARIKHLESESDQQKGWRSALIMTWIVLGGLGGLVAWLVSLRGSVK
jgi:hypothetical protein